MRKKGQNVILAIGIMIIGIIFGAFAIDFGFYYTVQSQMQAAADAAALASVQEMFKVTTQDPSSRQAAAKQEAADFGRLNWNNDIVVSDVTFGYVDPATVQYNSASFGAANTQQFPETSGFNAVQVVVKRNSSSSRGQIPTLFANALNIRGMNAQASAIAVFRGEPTSVTGDLRPFFLCQAAYDLALSEYGDPTVPEITFYGDTFSVGSHTYNVGDYCPCSAGGSSAYRMPTSRDGTIALIRPHAQNGPPILAMANAFLSPSYGDVLIAAANGNANGNGNGNGNSSSSTSSTSTTSTSGTSSSTSGTTSGTTTSGTTTSGTTSSGTTSTTGGTGTTSSTGTTGTTSSTSTTGTGTTSGTSTGSTSGAGSTSGSSTGSSSGCNLPPGSFGLVNYDSPTSNGAAGASNVRDWIQNGYSGTVSKGDVYRPQPGTGGLSSATSELNGLVNSGETFTVPLYAAATGNGQNAQFNISGMAAFKLTGFDNHGNGSYLKGHFSKKICNTAKCSYSGATQNGPNSITSVRLVH